MRQQQNRAIYYINYAQLDHDFMTEAEQDLSPEALKPSIQWSLKIKSRQFEIKDLKFILGITLSNIIYVLCIHHPSS